MLNVQDHSTIINTFNQIADPEAQLALLHHLQDSIKAPKSPQFAQNFTAFTQEALKQLLHPRVNMLEHHHQMCVLLELLMKGEITHLLVNAPPKSNKTTIHTVLWPVWILVNNPNSQIMLIGSSGRVARERVAKIRAILESAWFKQHFPEVQLSSKTGVETTEGGMIRPFSMLGNLDDFHADHIIIDEPHAGHYELTERQSEKISSWFFKRVLNKLRDDERSTISIFGMRDNDHDIFDKILRKHTGDIVNFEQQYTAEEKEANKYKWHYLDLQSIATKDRDLYIGTLAAAHKTGQTLGTNKEVLTKRHIYHNETNFRKQHQQRHDKVKKRPPLKKKIGPYSFFCDFGGKVSVKAQNGLNIPVEIITTWEMVNKIKLPNNEESFGLKINVIASLRLPDPEPKDKSPYVLEEYVIETRKLWLHENDFLKELVKHTKEWRATLILYNDRKMYHSNNIFFFEAFDELIYISKGKSFCTKTCKTLFTPPPDKPEKLLGSSKLCDYLWLGPKPKVGAATIGTIDYLTRSTVDLKKLLTPQKPRKGDNPNIPPHHEVIASYLEKGRQERESWGWGEVEN